MDRTNKLHPTPIAGVHGPETKCALKMPGGNANSEITCWKHDPHSAEHTNTLINISFWTHTCTHASHICTPKQRICSLAPLDTAPLQLQHAENICSQLSQCDVSVNTLVCHHIFNHIFRLFS